MSVTTSDWAPTIDDTTEIIGILLLFVPYMIILLPFLQARIVTYFQSLYLHRTPRDDWNAAVDQHPPRRLAGYILSIIFTFSAIWLLLIKNHYNNYWLDFFQYFIYLSLPIICSIIRPVSHQPFDKFDILILLFVIIPIEISEKVDSFLPNIQFALYKSWGNSPNISILHISAFNLFLFIFFIFRPLNNIGLTWDITNNNFSRLKWILLRFVSLLFIFLIVAIPYCLIPGIEYLHSPKKVHNVWIDGVARYFGLFFFQILLFEMLYRGVIQNLMHCAFDFRSEARSYLRGGGEHFHSLIDTLDDFDESNDETSRKNKQKVAFNTINSLNSINVAKNNGFRNEDTVDVNTLPYFEGSDGDSDEDKKSIRTRCNNYNTERDTLSCSRPAGICYFLRFDHLRDWFIIIVSSVIYAGTILDYKHYENETDLFYGGLFMFWLSICCGWLFRLTNSCFCSAIFNSIIFFNFKYIFNPNDKFCNGAC